MSLAKITIRKLSKRVLFVFFSNLVLIFSPASLLCMITLVIAGTLSNYVTTNHSLSHSIFVTHGIVLPAGLTWAPKTTFKNREKSNLEPTFKKKNLVRMKFTCSSEVKILYFFLFLYITRYFSSCVERALSIFGRENF